MTPRRIMQWKAAKPGEIHHAIPADARRIHWPDGGLVQANALCGSTVTLGYAEIIPQRRCHRCHQLLEEERDDHARERL
ncbi:MAG: hypothetical protein ACOC9T_00040 [Myxococcota bacterium]